MAKRKKSSSIKSLLSNQYVKYGLYGVAAYYAYNYFTGKPFALPFSFMQSSVTPPQAQVSAYPTLWLP